MQFRLWRAAAFVSSRLHLLLLLSAVVVSWAWVRADHTGRPSCWALPTGVSHRRVGSSLSVTTVNHSLPVGTRTCAFAYPVGSYCFAGLTSELFLCWLLIGFSLFGRSCGSFDHPGSGTPLRFPASTVGPTQFGFDLHIYAIETAHALQALRQSSQSHFSVPETQLNTEELMA